MSRFIYIVKKECICVFNEMKSLTSFWVILELFLFLIQKKIRFKMISFRVVDNKTFVLSTKHQCFSWFYFLQILNGLCILIFFSFSDNVDKSFLCYLPDDFWLSFGDVHQRVFLQTSTCKTYLPYLYSLFLLKAFFQFLLSVIVHIFKGINEGIESSFSKNRFASLQISNSRTGRNFCFLLTQSFNHVTGAISQSGVSTAYTFFARMIFLRTVSSVIILQ